MQRSGGATRFLLLLSSSVTEKSKDIALSTGEHTNTIHMLTHIIGVGVTSSGSLGWVGEPDLELLVITKS